MLFMSLSIATLGRRIVVIALAGAVLAPVAAHPGHASATSVAAEETSDTRILPARVIERGDTSPQPERQPAPEVAPLPDPEQPAPVEPAPGDGVSPAPSTR